MERVVNAPDTLTKSRTQLFDDDELRVDGSDKVSGLAVYTADISKPNMLWAAYATSPIPHGRILAVDTCAAKAVSGVRAVLTGEDIGPHRFGRQLLDWPVLAYEKVRFTGERVVAVAAESRAAAEEAARLIEVDYEDLPSVFEGSAALADDAPILHEHGDDYAFLGGTRRPRSHINIQGEVRHKKGAADLGPIFASAHSVFEHRFTTPRQHHGFIEPHATVVWIEPNGVVHVHTPNKAPFRLRQQMAAALGIPIEQLVIEPSSIGGDFGGKGLAIDEFSCFFLARATGRPVKSVMSYVEELQGTNTRHRAEIRLKTGLDVHGKFVAHEAEVIYNGGAYAAAKPNVLLLPGGPGFAEIGYQVPNVQLDICAVYTNTVPAGNMRTPTDVQCAFAWEGHIDMIARTLGFDPLDFRLLNAMRDGESTLTGAIIREPSAVNVLEAVKREVDWAKPLPPGHGRGIALGCKETGQGRTGVIIVLAADGRLQVRVGVPDQGTGSSTMIQRVVAAELSINKQRINVLRQNTSKALPDAGAGSSRVTHIVGAAAQVAARRLRLVLEDRSGMQLHHDDFVDVAGNHETFDNVVARLCADGPIEAAGEFDSARDDVGGHDYSFTAYAIEVAVDLKAATVRVIDAVLAIDIGTIINPIAHQGQIDGGFIYGLGSALFEELSYEDGKLTTLSLGNYKLPSIRDIPSLRTVHVQGVPGNGPFGAKMVGELTNSGVAPAIANAVCDAVGARLMTFPITPERLYRALHESVACPERSA
jgi:CO/xanthine dehydrogenase Mo-binding subunit